jgi:pimeloyl-ACP methyl ester carboxylesterase
MALDQLHRTDAGGRAGPRSASFTGNGLRHHYLVWEGGSDTTAVLLHGGRDHARTWDDVAARLPSTWTLVAPDLRGHGDSDWATGGVYALWDSVGDVDHSSATWAAPVRRCSFGHSLGGAIALQFAGARPDVVDAQGTKACTSPRQCVQHGRTE